MLFIVFYKNICKNSFQNARRSVYFYFFIIFCVSLHHFTDFYFKIPFIFSVLCGKIQINTKQNEAYLPFLP